MPEDKIRKHSKIRVQSLSFLSSLGLWSGCGSNWSSTIKNEIQEDINQTIEEKRSNPTSKVVYLGILTTLALLSAAMWNQAPRIYQTLQGIGVNSVEQPSSKDY